MADWGYYYEQPVPCSRCGGSGGCLCWEQPVDPPDLEESEVLDMHRGPCPDGTILDRQALLVAEGKQSTSPGLLSTTRSIP